MSRRKKIILWAGGALGIVLVLLLILILLLPRLINIEPVRERILATISQTVGGKVELQQVDLSFFPRPRVVVHKASLSIPGKVAGTLESATIYPEILPLFRGRVRITDFDGHRLRTIKLPHLTDPVAITVTRDTTGRQWIAMLGTGNLRPMIRLRGPDRSPGLAIRPLLEHPTAMRSIDLDGGADEIALAGTDGEVYTCNRGHISANANRPITGADYQAYWRQEGSTGGAWGAAQTSQNRRTFQSQST